MNGGSGGVSRECSHARGVPRVFHALKTPLFRELLQGLGLQMFQLYLDCIEQIDWLHVLFRRSSRSLKLFSGFNLSSGREGEAGDFEWVDPLTAGFVDGNCPKHRRAQIYSRRPKSFHLEMKRRRCEGASRPGGSCPAKSVVGRRDDREAGSPGYGFGRPRGFE